MRTIGRKYKVSSSSEAIKLAIRKNISGAMDYLYGSAQRNVGMGLYVISKIVKDTDGVMCIVSDDSIAKYTPSEHVKIRRWLDRGRENKGLW